MDDSGDRLYCSTICYQVLVVLGSHIFHIDFSFTLGVMRKSFLGAQWMKTLGPITTDYSKLTMTFQWQNKQVPLHGFIDGQLKVISSSQLKRINVRYV